MIIAIKLKYVRFVLPWHYVSHVYMATTTTLLNIDIVYIVTRTHAYDIRLSDEMVLPFMPIIIYILIKFIRLKSIALLPRRLSSRTTATTTASNVVNK